MSNSKTWNNRGLTSLFLTFAFLIILVTGVILYIVPQGRIAYWVDWKMFGLTKTQWGNIHIASGFMMLIASAFHIYFNWKPLIRYFVNKVNQVKQINLKGELALSIVVTVFIIVGSVQNWPPLNYLFDLGDEIKGSWIISKDYEPPVGHAEQLSLSVLSKRMKFSLPDAVKELKSNGIKMGSAKESLGKIALSNGKSPMEVYGMIKHLVKKPKPMQQNKMTPEIIEERFAGTGLGRKQLAEVILDLKIDKNKAIERLEKQGIKYSAEATLKEIAAEKEITPIDVLKVILIEEFRP